MKRIVGDAAQLKRLIERLSARYMQDTTRGIDEIGRRNVSCLLVL